MLRLTREDPRFVPLPRGARAGAAELGQKSGLPDEVVQQVLAGVNEAGRFADLVAGYIDINPAQRQALLETLSVEERLRRGPLPPAPPTRRVRPPPGHKNPPPREAGGGRRRGGL